MEYINSNYIIFINNLIYNLLIKINFKNNKLIKFQLNNLYKLTNLLTKYIIN